MQIHCKACGRLYDAPASIDGPGCPACTNAMVSPPAPVAIVHHASWHLLRKYKPKARTRRTSRATAGALGRKNEIVLIQLQQALLRAQQADAGVRAMYAAMQSVELKQEV